MNLAMRFRRTAVTFVLLGLAAGAAARLHSPSAPLPQPAAPVSELGRVISAQGNAALEQLRHEAREAVLARSRDHRLALLAEGPAG